MRSTLQRAAKLVAAGLLACTLLPAEHADAAVVCGYVRVQMTTLPLLTLCGPGSCTGPHVGPTVVGPTETYVCVTV